jgi:hypothetical protein
VVNDQLVPLLPHEVEQSLTGSGSQSPGLATLAAAAAAAGQRGGGPHGMAPEAGAAHTYTGVQAPLLSSYPGSHSLGGEMYVLNHAGGGTPMGGFHPGHPPQYMLHQQIGYSMPYAAHNQPLYMDGVGMSMGMSIPYSGGFIGSLPMGGLSVTHGFPMNTISLQPPVSLPVSGAFHITGALPQYPPHNMPAP